MRRGTLITASLALLAMASCARDTRTAGTIPSPDTTQTVQPLPDGRIPAGTTVWIALDQKIDKDTAKGDRFTGRVSQPLVADDGRTLIPEGTRVTGRVAGHREGRGDEPDAVAIQFDHMELAGDRVPVSGEVVATDVPGDKKGVMDAITSKEAMIGAAAGAVIGGVMEGWKGAIVGGLLGGGAGSLISVGRNGDEGIPRGTQMALELDEATPSLASLRKGRRYE